MHGVRLPEFVVEEKYYEKYGIKNHCDNYTFLRELCNKAYLEKGINKLPNKKDYIDRVKYELETLNELGFVDYILLIWDIINYCKENDIPTGPGRGSAAGSCVLYFIGITDVDPIKYSLYFERFVSKSRAKKIIIDGITYLDGSLLPDIDSDICYYKRQKVIEYLQNKFPSKTCKILTINTLSGKLVLKETIKTILEYPEEDVKVLAGYVEKVFGNVEKLSKTAEENAEFKKWLEKPKQQYEFLSNKESFGITLKLENLPKNFGVHPSAIAVSYGNLNDLMPTQATKVKNSDTEQNEIHSVSGFDMNWVAKMAVKVDLLGLRAVSIVDDICESIGIKTSDINVEDLEIYKPLQDLKSPHGIFQIEADTQYRVCRKVKPENLNEVSDLIALARPGGIESVPTYVENKGRIEFEKIHPEWDKIVGKTRGVLLYQEQITAIANKVFGVSLDEAEGLRKCITGDTNLVSQSRGFISINKLLETGYKDEYFLQMDENGKQFWGKIKDIWSNGIKQVIRVKTKNGMSIRASRWHQFLTDSGWKARNYLSENDYLVCAKEMDFTGTNVISREMAIIICGMVTKGYFVYNNSTFTNWDSGLMNKFSSAFKTEFGKEINISKDGRIARIGKEERDKINKYLKFGLSASKELPQEILGLTRDLSKEVIGFLYSCEGSFYGSESIGRHIEFSSASIKLVRQIQLMLLRFGVSSFINESFNKDYNKNYYKLMISGYKNQKLFKDLFSEHLSFSKINDLNKILICRNKNKEELIPFSICKRFINQYGFLLNYEGGHCLKNPMSKSKFLRKIEESNDFFWKNFIKGKQFYSKIEDLTETTREVEVYDFSMEDEGNPHVVADGIVIHNCVGKKLTNEMKVWEEKIKQKAVENNIDESIAIRFWELLRAAANYSFCASHARAYGTLSVLTLYLKFKYPQAFFLSLLKMSKNEPKPHLEISKISKELSSFGIKLLPPDLLKSQMEFSLEGSDIRYGLNSLKGVSEKTMEALYSFKSSYSNKFEMFQAANQAGLNIGVLSALIQAGALSSLGGSRAYNVLEAQVFNKLSDSEKKYILSLGAEFNFDLFALLKTVVKEQRKRENGKTPIIKESRYETIKKHSEKYLEIYQKNSKNEKLANWFFENKLLGYAYSATLFDILKDDYLGLSPLDKFDDFKDNDRLILAGIVVDVHNTKSRTDKKMFKLILEDGDKTLNTILYDKSYEKWVGHNTNNSGDVRFPQKEDIIIIVGRKSNDIVFLERMTILEERGYLKISDLKE